jgi:Bifunctional DNA primase/polymerase, N-terminal
MRKKFKSRVKTREDHDQRQRPQGNNKKSGSKKDSLLATALLYAKAGLPVVPLHGLKNGVCTCDEEQHCTEPGNHPRTPNGFRDATTNLKKIKRFWRKWPNAKIALPLGLDVIAVVVERQAGRKALKKLEERQ